jgi:Putative peptidoglycan-binding domain-containing protein
MLDNKKIAVSEVQTWLRALAKAGKIPRIVNIDGIYGVETEEAVTDFQIMCNLPATGMVDYATWCELYKEYKLLEDDKNMLDKLCLIYNCYFKK